MSMPTIFPKGGQDAIRRILIDDNGKAKTLLQLIQEKNIAQGKEPAKRADMRINLGFTRKNIPAEQG